ncbi:hypothetical protein ACGFWI_02235 [Streptomyces sp. NPDC048434]|uniref:hypothetical protein n=1 Tax=Streptomyces sp. NPDC048434 TaxID=3365549 RepID=UPI00370FDEAD
MKIIVIGATGTLSSAVARQLEQRGHEVVRAAPAGPEIRWPLPAETATLAR